ncbi:TlpA family protein disulfide reductase [Engelhardtia mirabilis]|uniref:Thiol-disulfide oxidoreductase ResA n=1 Tax=Engelhardtia mirabilis TaxID=2528011 RepID=A0A518BMX4_9BACT|nr:Thiol-disulfide oxidoreductase ResA [Planctomycetes bacterium Pla133]QDV02619.1 Thiol-disulfide oxidoreductase ResA [Planctomycetes bacterium Pla86]
MRATSRIACLLALPLLAWTVSAQLVSARPGASVGAVQESVSEGAPAPDGEAQRPDALEIYSAVYKFRLAHAQWELGGRRGRHPAREAYPIFDDLVQRGWSWGRLWLLENLDLAGLAPSDERRRRRSLVEVLLTPTADGARPIPDASAEAALLALAEHPRDFERAEAEPWVRRTLSTYPSGRIQAAGQVALGALLDVYPDPPAGAATNGERPAQSGPDPAEQLWRGVIAGHPETAAAPLAADLLLVNVERRYRAAADAWVVRWLDAQSGADPGPHPATETWAQVESLAAAGSGRALWWMAREVRHLNLDEEELAQRRIELLDRLIEEHTDAPWLAEAVQFSEVIVSDLGLEAVERLGRGLLEGSRDPHVRAWVLHGMATIAASDDQDPESVERAIALLERLQAEYPEDRLAEAAGSWLFALRHLRPGQIPPPREALDGDGQPIRLTDLRGEVALLVFWGWWSPVAAFELARVGELAERFDQRPFTVVGINSDDDPAAARTRFDEAGYDWRNVWEGRRSGPWTQSWHVRSFPTYFLLDADGRIVAVEQDLDAIIPRLESALEG